MRFKVGTTAATAEKKKSTKTNRRERERGTKIKKEFLFFLFKKKTKLLKTTTATYDAFLYLGFINTSISKRGKTNNLCSNTVQIGCHNGINVFEILIKCVSVCSGC